MLENFKYKILTVSQVSSYIKLMFESDDKLKNIFISGEISNFRPNYSSGHVYFSIKDDFGKISAVMFAVNFKRLKFKPEDGMGVVVRGYISSYEFSSQYQICVQDMQIIGKGEDFLYIEELKKKLILEGLFDESRKKAIPKYPKRIGIITSISGAVIHDIKNVIERRYPICSLHVISSGVQGIEAANGIISAIKNFNSQSPSVDVIILARGGGATEDLGVFNLENVARAVFESKIPIVSAIGHHNDWTICDYVADVRASTPSVAAELAVPDMNEIINFLDLMKKRLESSFSSQVNKKIMNFNYFFDKLKIFSPVSKIENTQKEIEKRENDISRVFIKKLTDLDSKLKNLEHRLHLMDPKSIFLKGYVFVKNRLNKNISFSDLKKGDEITLKCIDCEIDVAIKDIRGENIGV